MDESKEEFDEDSKEGSKEESKPVDFQTAFSGGVPGRV